MGWNESQARHELCSLEQDRAWMEVQLVTLSCPRAFPKGIIQVPANGQKFHGVAELTYS